MEQAVLIMVLLVIAVLLSISAEKKSEPEPEHDSENEPSYYTKLMALNVPVIDYKAKYGSDTVNEANGELVEFPNTGKYSNRLVTSEDGYGLIYDHVCGKWFKLVSKVKE